MDTPSWVQAAMEAATVRAHRLPSWEREDAIADGLLNACKAVARREDDRSKNGLAAVAARNGVIDSARRRVGNCGGAVRRAIPFSAMGREDDDRSFEDTIASPEEDDSAPRLAAARAVERLLARLPTQERAALEGVLDGETLADSAAALGTTPGAVKGLRQRARNRLAQVEIVPPYSTSEPLEILMTTQPEIPEMTALRTCEVPGCNKPLKGHRRCDAHLSKARRGGWTSSDPAGDVERHREHLARRRATTPAPAAPPPVPVPAPPPPMVTPGNPDLILSGRKALDALARCGAGVRVLVFEDRLEVELDRADLKPGVFYLALAGLPVPR